MLKRELDMVILSDVHLGTFACHARELLQYLKSIRPKTLVLNGDFVDMWEFKKNYFPEDHMSVLREILKMAANGTKVYYLTGNHDDPLRNIGSFAAGNLILRDKLVLQIDQKKYWIFHGDIFDASVTISPIIAKLGGRGYTWLVILNRWIDHVRLKFGYSRVSLANRIKQSMKRAIKYISDFEDIAIDHAQKQGYDFVICGHIHQPRIQHIPEKNITYMNSGDWVENLTALEYRYHKWSLYNYDHNDYKIQNPRLCPNRIKKSSAKIASYRIEGEPSKEMSA